MNILFGQRLAGRIGQVGGQGAGQATNRREHWGREEESARRERRGGLAGEDLSQRHYKEGKILTHCS